MNKSGKLAGKRVVVTRAERQAESLARLIRERGGVPLLFPCIAIEPPDDFSLLDSALSAIHEFDWIAFTSGNAVRATCQRLRRLGLQLDWSRVSIAAVGAQTDSALRDAIGRGADFVPAIGSGRSLAESLPISAGARILLPQSDRADGGTARILDGRGGSASAVLAYRVVVGSGGIDLAAEILGGGVDALTFASPSAVAFLLRRCDMPEMRSLPAACLGESTGAAVREAGFGKALAPRVAGVSEMLDALAEFFDAAKVS